MNSHGQGLSNSEPIPLDTSVRYGKLENGLTYYIRKNKGKGIEFRLIVKAGTSSEDPDQLELAHMVEHMGFRATTHFPHGVRRFLDTQGIRAKTNATTTVNCTTYYLNLLEAPPEHVTTCLKVLHEWASEVSFLPEDIDTERQVVLAESTDSPLWQKMQMVRFKMLGNPKYSLAHANETSQSIRSFRHSSLIRFYRDWYRPELLGVVIVGDLSPDDVQRQLAVIFRDLKNPNSARTAKNTIDAWEAALTGKNEIIRLTDARIRNPKVEFYMLKSEAIPFGKPITINHLRILATEMLFDQMVKKRLGDYIHCNSIFKSLHIQMQRSPFGALAKIDALHSVGEIGSLKSLKAAIQSIVTELERIHRFGFTEIELADAKQQVTGSLNEHKDSNHSIADRLADNFVFGSAAPDPNLEKQLQNSLVKDITSDEVNQTIEDRIDFDQNFDMILYAQETDAPSLPDDQELRDWIKQARNQKISRYKPTAVSEKPGVPIPPVEFQPLAKGPKYHVRRVKSIALTEYVLPNGIRAVLKPVQATGLLSDKIMVHGFSPGGASVYNGDHYSSAHFAASIIRYCGVEGAGRCELSDYLATRGMNVTPYINDREEGIMAYSSSDDLDALFRLIYQYFTSPKKDSTAYEHWLSMNKEQFKRNLSNPKSQFTSNESLTYQGTRPPSPPSPDQTDLDQAFDIYCDRFADASDFVFIITGNFKAKDIEPVMLKYLTRLPGLNGNEKRPKTPTPPSTTTINNYFFPGNNTRASVKLVFTQALPFTQSNSVKTSALGSAIQLALSKRLRGKEGGVYSVSVQTGFVTERDAYSITIRFICAPEAKQKMISATMEELQHISQNGPDPTSLKKAIQLLKDEYLRDMKDNQFWSNYLVQKYRHRQDPAQILQQPRLVNNLKSRSLRRTCKQLLRKGSYSLSILYDG